MESAYCNVPVHSDYHNLLVNLVLPFGLHSALFIFSSIEDLNGSSNIIIGLSFLLDDFHTLGPPNTPVCQNNIDTGVQLFGDWGIPLRL